MTEHNRAQEFIRAQEHSGNLGSLARASLTCNALDHQINFLYIFSRYFLRYYALLWICVTTRYYSTHFAARALQK